MKRLVIARPRRPSPVLICKKCLKRSPSGGRIRRALKRKLKRQSNETVKPSKLIATGCFGICPKRAIVLASGNSLEKGEYVLVSHRSQIKDAFAALQCEDSRSIR